MAQDCGLNLGKLKGSLAKSTGRTGIFDSGPSDRDLADQIGSAHILIGAVDSGSSGSGRKGATAAALVAGKTFPAAAPRRRGPKSAILGSNRRFFGSGGLHATCVIHWEVFRGSGRLGWGSPWRGADGAAAHRRRARAGAAGAHYRLH